MSLDGLRLRTKIIQKLRSLLVEKGFEEIETQLFSDADTLEPTIYPFKVGEYYLPTSPESFLKQAIAAGIKNCFAISHTFRNLEGRGAIHSPEFIMAEWYQQNATYLDMISLTQSLITTILPDYQTNPLTPWPVISWIDMWHSINLDLPTLIDDQIMIEVAKNKGYNTDNASWEQLFNQIADNEIVRLFPSTPFFLIDYPSKISPLALPKPDTPNFAERFELFINGIEIANGNTENFDDETIKKTMVVEQSTRKDSTLNQSFLNALSTLRGQQWAGVGVGIDRVTMIARGYDDISLVQTV